MSAAQPMVAVVIPARNEGRRVADVIRALPTSLPTLGRGRPAEVVTIVVDDGSDDGTGEAARAAGAIVVRHRVNLGKGAALTTGCDAALRTGADVIVLMDADGQHRPEDLPRLARPVLDGTADLALTVRSLSRHMPLTMRFGNRVLSGVLRMLFGVRATDSQCGYRALTATSYGSVRWRAADYAVESEMLVRAGRAGLRLVEIPIDTIYHDRYKGTQPLDGLRILRQILAWRLGA